MLAILGIERTFLPPQRSWGKVMFLHVCVILFTRGCLPQYMLGYPPPWQGKPPKQGDPPLARQTPTGKETPTCTVHAGRYDQQAGGTHPTGHAILVFHAVNPTNSTINDESTEFTCYGLS